MSLRIVSAQLVAAFIIISMMGLISLSEGAHGHAHAPSPAPSPHGSNGTGPPSSNDAVAEFAPSSLLSILVGALISSCMYFFY